MDTLKQIEDLLVGWEIESPRLSVLIAAGDEAAYIRKRARVLGCDPPAPLVLLVTDGTDSHVIQPARRVNGSLLTGRYPAIVTRGYLAGMPLAPVVELAEDLGDVLGLAVEQRQAA